MLKNWKQKTLLSLDFLTCKMKSKSFPALLIRLFIKIMTILTHSLSNRPPSSFLLPPIPSPFLPSFFLEFLSIADIFFFMLKV